MNTFGLVRIKRSWCPEWLWYFACNPVPFWNDIFPMYRIFLRPLTWLLSCDCERCMGEYWPGYKDG